MQHRAARSRHSRVLLWADIGCFLQESSKLDGHVLSAENHLADALSRLEKSLPPPPLLAKVPRTLVSDDGWRILGKR